MPDADTVIPTLTRASIFVEHLTIRNFKGIRELDLSLKPGLTLLVGRNNAGKTRVLRALHVAVGGAPVEQDDLTVGSTKPATIDAVLAPQPSASNSSGSSVAPSEESFDEELQPVFGNALNLISVSPSRQRVAWRTEILLTREGTGARQQSKVMTFSQQSKSWEPTNHLLQRQVRNLIYAELIDTQRDLDTELRQRGTAIRRILNDLQVDASDRDSLEQKLALLGEHILQKSVTLQELRNSLNNLDRYVDKIGNTQVNPVPQTLEELARTVGVSFGDQAGGLPSRLQGSGVRSLASLLVQDVFYRESLGVDGGDIRPHPVTLIEEPETHLHPHAVFEAADLLQTDGRQVVATTHSPLLATAVKPESILLVRSSPTGNHVTVDFGPVGEESIDSPRTKIPGLYAAEMEKLKRQVERPFGDLLFARAIVVGDGSTERAFLPLVLRDALGPLAHGISVVDSAGMDAPLVKAIIKFARHADIPIIVFADQDSAGTNAVKRLVKEKLVNDRKEVVWSGATSTDQTSSKHSAAIEMMILNASPSACEAACETLGNPVPDRGRLLPTMKKLKGSIGAVLAQEFVSRHPFASDKDAWPEPLLRLVQLMSEHLGVGAEHGEVVG